jgi:SAM-dependent methyltransferase
LPIVPLLVVELVSLFVLAVAVHGRLAADRPDERQLTRFYLILAAGGVLGTASVALMAPLVLDSIFEYPLLVVAASAALGVLPAAGAGVAPQPHRLLEFKPLVIRVLSFALVAVVLLAGLFAQDSAGASTLVGHFLVAAVIVAISARPLIATVATGALFGALIAATQTNPLHRERTFFGVLEVRGTAVEHALYSGTTLHGLQFLDHRRTMATTYFLPTGPFGGCVADLRARTGAAGARIVVAGLGAGVMAAFVEPGDEMTFIEIDPADVRIAQNPAYFTYLSDAPEVPKVIIGDGRLELAAMPSQSLDLIVLDAFTSDAVPAHLLTAEAIATYVDKLRPGGVACFQLSNRYYDLAPSVASTASSVRLDAVERVGEPTEQEKSELGAQGSFWLVVGHPTDVARFARAGWTRPPPGIVLTDDYSDLTRLLFEGPRDR